MYTFGEKIAGNWEAASQFPAILIPKSIWQSHGSGPLGKPNLWIGKCKLRPHSNVQFEHNDHLNRFKELRLGMVRNFERKGLHRTSSLSNADPTSNASLLDYGNLVYQKMNVRKYVPVSDTLYFYLISKLCTDFVGSKLHRYSLCFNTKFRTKWIPISRMLFCFYCKIGRRGS